jgi:hypothetical protein
MTTRRSRLWVAITVGAVLALAAASTASATMYDRERYGGEGAYSYDDCGFWVDVTFTFSGTAHIRTGKGKDAGAFFAHDNYSFREVHTRRDTGETFILRANGVFQETNATRIEGNVFEFTSINAGQPFVVTDSDGNVLVRDRGVIRETILFDTLGDDTPGGEFIASIAFDVHGPHPGLSFDGCGLFSEP